MDGNKKPYIPKGMFEKVALSPAAFAMIHKETPGTVSIDGPVPEVAPEPQFDFETFEIEIISEDTETDLKPGFAQYNVEQNKLTVHLYPYQHSFKLKDGDFLVNLGKGNTKFRTESIGNFEVDENKLPVCQYFVASKEHVRAELPAGWKFNTAFVQESCVCPSLGFSGRRPGQCTFSPTFNRCNSFAALENVAVAEVVNAEGVSVGTIMKGYGRNRIPRYSSELGDEFYEDIPSLSAMLEEGLEVQEVPVVINKNSYFEAVFIEENVDEMLKENVQVN